MINKQTPQSEGQFIKKNIY